MIEDAAHALGATLRKAPVGSFGDAAIFSLGRGKLLNTLGGGLCVVQGPEVAKRLNQEVDRLPATGTRRVLKEVVLEGVIEAGTLPAVFGTLAMPAIRFARRFGKDPMSQLFEDDKDAMTAVPAQLKRRLSNLQASFGCAGLAAFDRGLAKRRENAEYIRAALNGVIPTQRPVEGSDPAWLELTALVDDREAFQRALLARGVDTQRAWMDACDALPAFSSALSPPCPQARRVAASAVYLPTYAALTHAQRDLVVRAVCESLA